MSVFYFTANKESREIVDPKNKLDDFGIREQLIEAYGDFEDLTKYIFISNLGVKYQVALVEGYETSEYFCLTQYIEHNLAKGKYEKIENKRKRIVKIVSEIGLANAQQLHAQDLHKYSYMPLREYLKKNQLEFKKKYLYEKGFDGDYQILRHKNLFSKYHDEISDFERLTTIERNEPKTLKVGYELDEDVFEYDQSQFTIQERKFLREFAKDIYNKKNRYTERELFEILKGRDLYIQIVKVTPKEHKDVWSKITIEEMDIRILEKFRNDFYKQNVPQNKKRKYLSKKQKVRKNRRFEERKSSKALADYYKYEK